MNVLFGEAFIEEHMMDNKNFPQTYHGPVNIIFHPNVGYGLNTRNTNSIVLNKNRIDYETLEEYQALLNRRPSKILPGHRVVRLIDEVAHEYFKGWAKGAKIENPLKDDPSPVKAVDGQLRRVYDKTLMADESETAPWVSGVYQPWIMLNKNRDILGVKPRDIVDELILNQVEHTPLIGTTSQELRVAFVNGAAWSAKPQYKTIDLRPRQVDFFKRENREAGLDYKIRSAVTIVNIENQVKNCIQMVKKLAELRTQLLFRNDRHTARGVV